MTPTATVPATRSTSRPFRLDVHITPDDLTTTLVQDVRRGLGGTPRWLPPKYFYDRRGCELFEEITELPEYYQTRTELEILCREAEGIASRHHTAELVELGSGSSRKTGVLLDAMRAHGSLERYVPFDVAPGALLDAAGRLSAAYPGLRVHAVAGDFDRHLGAIPNPGRRRRMVAFIGSTIGNLRPSERSAFLRRVARLLGPDDRLLLGTDLAGDPERLVPAYNDERGVTAAFNLNVLEVLNRELGADFDSDRFNHVAIYDEARSRIEMRLRSDGSQRVRIPGAGLTIDIGDGEEILTELSCKFTRQSVSSMLADAGLSLEEWHEDAAGRFALSVAGPAGI